MDCKIVSQLPRLDAAILAPPFGNNSTAYTIPLR